MPKFLWWSQHVNCKKGCTVGGQNFDGIDGCKCKCRSFLSGVNCERRKEMTGADAEPKFFKWSQYDIGGRWKEI